MAAESFRVLSESLQNHGLTAKLQMCEVILPGEVDGVSGVPPEQTTQPCVTSPLELLKKRFRVKDVRFRLLKPATNHLRVDLGGLAEFGLRRTVFAHGFQSRLVKRLAVPKEKVD